MKKFRKYFIFIITCFASTTLFALDYNKELIVPDDPVKTYHEWLGDVLVFDNDISVDRSVRRYGEFCRTGFHFYSGHNVWAEGSVQALFEKARGSGGLVAGCGNGHYEVEVKKMRGFDQFFIDGSYGHYIKLKASESSKLYTLSHRSGRKAAIYLWRYNWRASDGPNPRPSESGIKCMVMTFSGFLGEEDENFHEALDIMLGTIHSNAEIHKL